MARRSTVLVCCLLVLLAGCSSGPSPATTAESPSGSGLTTSGTDESSPSGTATAQVTATSAAPSKTSDSTTSPDGSEDCTGTPETPTSDGPSVRLSALTRNQVVNGSNLDLGEDELLVHGKVVDDQDDRVANVSVYVNGTLASPDVKLSFGQSNIFVTTVNLSTPVGTVEVVPVDSDGTTVGGPNASAMLRIDGDGLPGRFERVESCTDPLDPDSGSDRESDEGTDDGTRDPDGDGLTNTEEYVARTDPLVADTDGDGVPDDEERSVVRHSKTGVSLSVPGNGHVDAISIAAVSNRQSRYSEEMRVAPMVKLGRQRGISLMTMNSEPTRFDEVRIVFPIETNVTDPSDLSVYVWRRDSDRPWHAVETDVDLQNGTASATVAPPGYVSVFVVSEWEDARSGRP